MDIDEIRKYLQLINDIDRDKLHMLIEAAIGYLDDHLPEILEALQGGRQMSLFFDTIRLARQIIEIKQAWDGRACRHGQDDGVDPAPPGPSPHPGPSPDPLPPTVPVRGIRFRWDTLRKLARGSDNHACTWVRDGGTCLVWGDGQGFAQSGPKRSLGISRRVGDRFRDIGHGNGKCYGVIGLGNTLYLWRGPNSMADAIRQTDLEQWELMADGQARFVRRVNFWHFDRGIFHPTFVQHGCNNQWARDGWIYSLSTRGSKIKFEIQEGPGGADPCDIWLIKQPIGQMMNPGAVQYFAGRHGGHATWSPFLNSARPVVTMHKSFLISCAYLKPLNRYLMWNSFDWRGGDPFRADLQVWDAEYVWGPWRKVGHWINWGKGHIYPSAFYWNVDPATISPGGRRMKLIFSGGGQLDAYHDMDIELVT